MAEAENEISLPKATIQKLVKEFVSPDYRVAGDLLDLLMACCTGEWRAEQGRAATQGSSVGERCRRVHTQVVHPAVRRVSVGRGGGAVQRGGDAHDASSASLDGSRTLALVHTLHLGRALANHTTGRSYQLNPSPVRRHR